MITNFTIVMPVMFLLVTNHFASASLGPSNLGHLFFLDFFSYCHNLSSSSIYHKVLIDILQPDMAINNDYNV